ncbi:hypothetical protein DERP_000461 [Dermatophagoides pteronyssinus]|uniref:Uncharacterized protein n=1 Tax=Dermatophagoides pteronyssinus TaxID=6956 RepID=A0ABQ8J0B5_DERPT|nr:hypothetical protein DERP_000461 [Dermatophagoides pteronyssinus]
MELLSKAILSTCDRRLKELNLFDICINRRIAASALFNSSRRSFSIGYNVLHFSISKNSLKPGIRFSALECSACLLINDSNTCRRNGFFDDELLGPYDVLGELL